MLEDAKDTFDAARRLAYMLPEIAEKAEMLSTDMETMIKNGMRLDPETTQAICKAEARNNRCGHLGFGGIGRILGILRLNH